MTEQYDRLAARDAAIRAMLPHVAEMGWTRAALREGAGADADLLFPGGAADMVAAYIDMADRDMAALSTAVAGERPSRRVRSLILARLEQAAPYRVAVRRGLAVLTQPGNVGAAMRTAARTVDTIWFAAGDTSSDWNWYSKRALLGGVYTSTLLYWLARERTPAELEAFLDRRLAGVAQIGKLRARFAA